MVGEVENTCDHVHTNYVRFGLTSGGVRGQDVPDHQVYYDRCLLHILPEGHAHQLQVPLQVAPEELWQCMWLYCWLHQLQKALSGRVRVAAGPDEGRVHDSSEDVASSW